MSSIRVNMTTGQPSLEDIKKACEELDAHENIEEMARAISGALFERADRSILRPDAEPGLIERLEKESELIQEKRKTDIGDPFEILEHGPKTKEQAALLSVLLARSMTSQIKDSEGGKERRELIEKMVEGLDWISATTSLSPYHSISILLDSEMNTVFWTVAIGKLARELEDEYPDPTRAARARLRHIVRASALDHVPQDQKTEFASQVLAEIKDEEIKRIALAALAGVEDTDAEKLNRPNKNDVSAKAASAARAPKLDGNVESRPWGPLIRIITAVTGILLLRWLIRTFAGFALGLRNKGRLTLTANAVKLERTLSLFGREISSKSVSYSLRSLRAGGVEKQFRYLHLLVGSLGLVLGAALGVNFLVEGTCSGYASLALFGFAVIAGGIILDILLEVLIPERGGVSTVSLDFGKRKFVRLRGVDHDKASAFAKELDQLIPAPRSSDSPSPAKSGAPSQ